MGGMRCVGSHSLTVQVENILPVLHDTMRLKNRHENDVSLAHPNFHWVSTTRIRSGVWWWWLGSILGKLGRMFSLRRHARLNLRERYQTQCLSGQTSSHSNIIINRSIYTSQMAHFFPRWNSVVDDCLKMVYLIWRDIVQVKTEKQKNI